MVYIPEYQGTSLRYSGLWSLIFNRWKIPTHFRCRCSPAKSNQRGIDFRYRQVPSYLPLMPNWNARTVDQSSPDHCPHSSQVKVRPGRRLMGHSWPGINDPERTIISYKKIRQWKSRCINIFGISSTARTGEKAASREQSSGHQLSTIHEKYPIPSTASWHQGR